MTMDAYLEEQGQTLEEFEADLERRVRDAVAAQFVLDEIAKKEELGVDQNELSQHLVRRAQQSGQDPQEFANHMFEHNHIPELVQEILRGKALAQHRRVGHRHRRVRQPGRAEEPAPRRHHRRAGGRGRRPSPTPRPRPTTTPTTTPRTRRAPRRRASARSFTGRLGSGGMTQVAPGPTVLDALSLLAEVGRRAGRAHAPATPTWPSSTGRPAGRACTAASPARSTAGSAGGLRRREPRARPGRPRPASGRGSRPTPRGRFVSSAVNGLIGDRLLRERPQLAIPMAVRLRRRRRRARAGRRWPRRSPRPPAGSWSSCTGCARTSRTGSRHRERTGTTYAEMLAERGWTPVMLRANTGLPLRENGAALTALLQRLVEAWPVQVTRIALVGHSLGGLVMRAAGAVASEVEEPWSRAGHRRGHARHAAPRRADRVGHRPRQPRARPSCRRPRRSAGSSTGARSACTTWSPAWPRTCRRCRTPATTWSPRR